MLNGYKEAVKMNILINNIYKKDRPNPQNLMEWMKFCRTVRTTCELIEYELGLIQEERLSFPRMKVNPQLKTDPQA